MGEALFELEQSIRSKKEVLTSREANILMSFKAKALREFTIGAGAGAGITWLATRKLNQILCISLSGGAAAFYGLWRFGRSLDSSVQHILSMDGTRMQKELAIIMLQKHQSDHRVIQHVSKHFYSENVFDDSSLEQPKLRWRYRNFFDDTIVRPQKTYDDDDSRMKTSTVKIETDETVLKPKLASANPGFEEMVNPFDSLFGFPEQVEDIRHPDNSRKTSRRHSRHHKRSRHRRHQQIHPQELS